MFDIWRASFHNTLIHGAQMTNVNEAVEKEFVFRRDLGRRIVEIRHRQGLSQAALARILGIVSCRLSHWEHGFHLPSLVQVVEIAVALKVGLDELVLGKAPAPPTVMSLTLKQYERLAVSLQTAMEVLRNEEQRERRTLATRPEAPKQGSISPRRSR
jgi:transcriptional regulator with XRE-family HTH domain